MMKITVGHQWPARQVSSCSKRVTSHLHPLVWHSSFMLFSMHLETTQGISSKAWRAVPRYLTILFVWFIQQSCSAQFGAPSAER